MPYLYSFKIYHRTSGPWISTNQNSIFALENIFFLIFFYEVKIPKIMKQIDGCK